MKRKPFYAESTLFRLYNKIGFDTVDLISDYLTAFSNLYGIIETDEAWDIIQHYFDMEAEAPFTKEQFDEYLQVAARDESNDFFVDNIGYYYDDAPDIHVIVNKDITMRIDEDVDEETIDMITRCFIEGKEYEGPAFIHEDISYFWKIYENRSRKPYYVPEYVWEFLKYSIEGYYEETPATKKMLSFLKKKCKLSQEKAELYISDLLDQINDPGNEATDIFNIGIGGLESNKVKINDTILSDFCGLLSDLNNQARLWVNKGHSPMELSRNMKSGKLPIIEFGPGIRKQFEEGTLDADEFRKEIIGDTNLPLEVRGNLLSEIERCLKPGEEKWVNGTLVKGAKIGPNDPCPCGSGKKYKKCCGRSGASQGNRIQGEG